MKKSKIISFATKSISSIALVSCLLPAYSIAETTLEKAMETGTLNIAIGIAPPYSGMTSDGEITGGAPDVTKAVLKEMGITNINASVAEYGALIPGLMAGRYDLVAAGLYINKKRCNAVLFSEPDLCGTEGFALKAGNPFGIQSYEDIAKNPEIKMGTCGGCTEESLAREAGIPRSQITTIPDEQSALKMLQDGRIDVYAYPSLSIASLLKKANDPSLMMIPQIKNTDVACAGAVFRKSDREFRDAYDEALKRLKENGKFDSIVSEYGFPPETAKSTTREELCEGEN
jgi:polar amino acid transport system substrate-binding protein